MRSMQQAGEDMKKNGVSLRHFCMYGGWKLMKDLIMGVPRGYTFISCRSCLITIQERGIPPRSTSSSTYRSGRLRELLSSI